MRGKKIKTISLHFLLLFLVFIFSEIAFANNTLVAEKINNIIKDNYDINEIGLSLSNEDSYLSKNNTNLNIDEKAYAIYKYITSPKTAKYNPINDLDITEQDIVNGINILRKEMGLNSFEYNNDLSDVANEHLKYLKTNSFKNPHLQEEGKNNFTGISASNRVKNSNYDGTFAGEVINLSRNSVVGGDMLYSLSSWINKAPYHFELFINPNVDEIGFSSGDNGFDGFSVVNFGKRNKQEKVAGIITYPVDQAEYVDNEGTFISETPNPFPYDPNIFGKVFTIRNDSPLFIDKNSIELTDMISGEKINIVLAESYGEGRKIQHFITKSSNYLLANSENKKNAIRENRKFQISFLLKDKRGNTEEFKSEFYTGNKKEIENTILLNKQNNNETEKIKIIALNTDKDGELNQNNINVTKKIKINSLTNNPSIKILYNYDNEDNNTIENISSNKEIIETKKIKNENQSKKQFAYNDTNKKNQFELNFTKQSFIRKNSLDIDANKKIY